MNDLIKWIAESDPWIVGHSLATCFYCKRKSLDVKIEDHAPGCWYVWCREQAKTEETIEQIRQAGQTIDNVLSAFNKVFGDD